MNLSSHFTLEEFTRSQIALRGGIPNVPNGDHIGNLTRLCVEVLEPARALIRQHYPTATIRITSGFRSKALNEAIPGSSKSSAHMDGRAADIEVIVDGREISVIEVFTILRGSGLPFDQLIQECGMDGWNHLGIAAIGVAPRGQFLLAQRSADGVSFNYVMA